MTLTQEQIKQLLQRFPKWKLGAAGRELIKEIIFTDFAAAMAYVNAVAKIAEAQQHHPDIQVSYNKVTLKTSSHDAGNLTDRDAALVEKIEAIQA